MWEQVQETVSYIKEKIDFTPEYGVILGSGLGSFTDEIKVKYTLAYHEIPNFPVSTVQGHKGALIFGTIGTKNSFIAITLNFDMYFQSNALDKTCIRIPSNIILLLK